MKIWKKKRIAEALKNCHDLFYECFGVVVDWYDEDGMIQTICPHEKYNPFCRMVSCQETQTCLCSKNVRQLQNPGGNPDQRVIECLAGLIDITIPVYSCEGYMLGKLCAGQFFLQPPAEEKFQELLRHLENTSIDRDELRCNYFNTPVFSVQQIDAMLKFLAYQGQVISDLSRQLHILSNSGNTLSIPGIQQYMANHFKEPLTTEKFAALMNLSISRFGHLFREKTGYSPMTYLNKTRIEHACELLQNTNLQISEIAFESGFSSLSHFNSTFKKITGKTASAYKKSTVSCKG